MNAAAMMFGSLRPDFESYSALKDGELALELMSEASMNDEVTDADRRQFAAASDAGHGAEDMAAVVHAFRQ